MGSTGLAVFVAGGEGEGEEESVALVDWKRLDGYAWINRRGTGRARCARRYVSTRKCVP